MEIKDLLEEFKLDMEINNYSKESLRSYSNCIKLFSTYLTDVLSITQIEKVKAVHIKAFVKFNKDKKQKLRIVMYPIGHFILF
ncbi:site-specific integrase [Intestinibacter bartlettii]|uniref:site-specific integrase n=1 Tax=Intestinibacter bartlettii TaxID=261299 RepID=UPI0039948571